MKTSSEVIFGSYRHQIEPYNFSWFCFRNVPTLGDPRMVEGDRGDHREIVRLSQETHGGENIKQNNHLRTKARPISVGKLTAASLASLSLQTRSQLPACVQK